LLRNIPVVIISGNDDMESVVRCIEMGAVDHLSKPFDPVLLHARIRSAFAIKQVEAISEEIKTEKEVVEEQISEEQPSQETYSIADFLQSLGPWCQPYKSKVIFLGLLLLLSLGIEAALPMGFKFITDDALIPHNFRVLVMTIGALITALITVTLIQIIADYLYVRLATKVLNDLRFNMYRHLQRLSMGFYSRVSHGEITTRFTTDLAAVENTVMLCLPVAFGQVVIVYFTIILLLMMEWSLAALAMIGLYITFKMEQTVESPAAKADAQMKMEQAKIAAVLQENVSAQQVVKSFRLQQIVIERFKHQMVNFFQTAARASFLSYLTERVPGKCAAFCGLFTISVGVWLTFYGYLTLGELISFQVLLTALITAVGDLSWSLPHLVKASGGMCRIDQLIKEKPEVIDAPDAEALPRPDSEISLNNVTFGYTDNKDILKNVSMTIKTRQFVLLVGPSGCGKSTVLNLLMRFYDPRQGSIFIDGYDLKQITQDSLRQHIGIVLQENFLFNTTIRENIRIGKQGATDEEVENAAKLAEVHDIIINLPEGYNTIVGERGSNLSGGQRQRVAIARAILSDPPILLLDEATSALDPTTASSIDRALQKVGKGRTLISVTHRLDPAPEADCIFVFKDGRLVESGSHNELLTKGELYSQLWNKQTAFVLSEDGYSTEVDIERLRDIPILSRLDEDSLKMVADALITERFSQGKWIFQEGEPGNKFYIIVRGRVAVCQKIGGKETRLAVLEDGDYFGENALLKNIPRTAGILALKDCFLLSLAAEHFLRLMEHSPQMRSEINRILSERANSPEN